MLSDKALSVDGLQRERKREREGEVIFREHKQ